MKFNSLIIGMVSFAITSFVWAGNDPSIKGQLRVDIQQAMSNHIKGNEISNKYVIFDAMKGNLKRLTLKKLHDGIVKKGEFYVSCADFLDAKGNLYDLDFLVAKKDGKYKVLQALIHKADGKKRKYHVEG